MTGLSIGTGAVVEYLLDPDRGKARRARVRDKAAHAAHQLNDGVGGLSRDTSNRSRGMLAAARYRVDGRSASDSVLHERVRETLGRHTTHPHAVRVTVEKNTVTLTGDVLAAEDEQARRAIKRIPGVKKVEAQWHVHDSSAGIPQLQGEGRRAHVPDEHWSPTVRLLTGAGTVAAWTASRRLPASVAWPVRGASSLLAARAAANLPLRRLTGITGGRRAIDVRGAITIAAPPEEIWQLVGDYTAFPDFMPDVKEVRRSDDGRLSHWVVAGPAGAPIGYDAEETRRHEPYELAWKTTEGQLVAHAGRLRLDPMGDGRTRVQVHLSYNPAAGALGHGLAKLLGADPSRKIKRSLNQLKSLVETVKVS